MEACKCLSFLRPLCDCKEPSGGHKLAGPKHKGHVDHPTPHPSPFFLTPHTLHKPHLLFSIRPSAARLHTFGLLPSTNLAVPGSIPLLSFSFLHTVPIHLIRQHPISLSPLACQGKWRYCLPGTCCFSKHTR